MKLAEALIIRADLQKKRAALKLRLAANCQVQEGDLPAESPQDLLVESQRVIGELGELIRRIHRTNAEAQTADGRNMLDLLVERDTLADRHALLQHAINSCDTSDGRYSYREIRWQTMLDIAALQKQADDIAVKLRNLNMAIQAANWQVELME